MISNESYLADVEVFFVDNTPQIDGMNLFARFNTNRVDGEKFGMRINCQLFKLGVPGNPPKEDCKLQFKFPFLTVHTIVHTFVLYRF